MSDVVGVGLGGTGLRAAVVDTSTGSLVRALRVPTPSATVIAAAHWLDRQSALCSAASAQARSA